MLLYFIHILGAFHLFLTNCLISIDRQFNEEHVKSPEQKYELILRMLAGEEDIHFDEKYYIKIIFETSMKEPEARMRPQFILYEHKN